MRFLIIGFIEVY